MIPNKSMYCSADAAEINLYELNFARFFSIRTSENGWRRRSPGSSAWRMEQSFPGERPSRSMSST